VFPVKVSSFLLPLQTESSESFPPLSYLSLSRALSFTPFIPTAEGGTPRGEVLAIAAQARRERGGVLPKLCHACVLPMFDG
jgi:hypothetical protein